MAGESDLAEFYGAVTVGERGQIVIPAEARRVLDIKPGDKLLVFSHTHKGLTIVKAQDVFHFVDGLRSFLASMEAAAEAEEEDE